MPLLSTLRDRLVANPAFRAWAARFPLTRPIARRRAQALFDLVAGFTYTQILLACVQLDLFERLRTPRTADDLAPDLGLTPEATDRLLAAATALNLLERRGPKYGPTYGLGPLGGAMLGNPAVSAMVRHHAAVYPDLADPVALLKAGQGALARYWPYATSESPAALPPDQVAAYSDLMAASQPLVATEILEAYPIRRHHTLMDVAGGDGTFLTQAHAHAPTLNLILFDLPPVAARAQSRFTQANLQAQAIGGDAFHDPLPKGADLITLIRVIHDHDDTRALTLLRAAHAALPKGGTLLMAEPMAELPGAERVGDAYFGMYLLAMGSGRARTPARLKSMLAEAGFPTARLRPTAMPLQTGLIVATA